MNDFSKPLDCVLRELQENAYHVGFVKGLAIRAERAESALVEEQERKLKLAEAIDDLILYEMPTRLDDPKAKERWRVARTLSSRELLAKV